MQENRTWWRFGCDLSEQVPLACANKYSIAKHAPVFWHGKRTRTALTSHGSPIDYQLFGNFGTVEHNVIDLHHAQFLHRFIVPVVEYQRQHVQLIRMLKLCAACVHMDDVNL